MKFKLPELGENIEEAQVVSVSVSAGDTVEKDQTLFEIETDKATLEVPSPASGTVESLEVEEGDTLKVGQVVATIEESGGGEEDSSQADDRTPDDNDKDDEDSGHEESANGPSDSTDEDDKTDSGREDKEEVETAEKDTATTEDDSSNSEKIQKPDDSEERVSGKEDGDSGFGDNHLPVFAAPSVRILAREIGIDLSEVAGTGPGGRISAEDVKRHARHNRRSSASARAVTPLIGGPLPDFSQWGDVEPLEMSGIRRRTAEHMARSWAAIPHVTLNALADASRLEQGIERHQARVDKTSGVKLTVTAVLLKLTASALRIHPEFRVSVDMEKKRLIHKHYCHIGVAVDTPKGLVVPVIRNVDEMAVSELAEELQQLANKAREGKLAPGDMQGGVFTLTNLGGLGTGFFTPIVNHPEVAILGIGRITSEPVWDASMSQFNRGRRMPLSLTFDHRALDGADGARFLQWMVDAIEDPLLSLIDKPRS